MAKGFACARKDKGVACEDCDGEFLDTAACADNAREEKRVLLSRLHNERGAGCAATIARFLRAYARKDIATENKLAANGAYKSSSEAANWRMGIEAAADAVERGDWRRHGDR